MKKVIVMRDKEYTWSHSLMDEYGITLSQWETLQRNNMLPPAIKLGRYRYYCRRDLEDRLLTDHQ